MLETIAVHSQINHIVLQEWDNQRNGVFCTTEGRLCYKY